ncbi:MAG: carboxypeptidase-like regulatory domain-containing protein [Bacteroidetes bacterium]|nr:carboxypeptidase-like regulatory domain-containing protein [Bacteroidota bacterium]
MKKYFLLLVLVTLMLAKSDGQKLQKNDLVQFSGVVVTGDSLRPVPFASIMIKSTFRGTISDYYGFFSFVARMRDTVEFSALGFKKTTFIIPDTLTDNRCSLIQILKGDTINLPEARVFPWPSKEQFKEAFLTLHIPDDDMERAKKNLDPYKMIFLAENTPMDGSMNFRNQMQQQSSRLYYSGQLPPNNLLNPIAWAKFIQAWQDGAFKSREYK